MKKKRKWLRVVLIIVLVTGIVAAFFLWPVKYRVEKSVVINKPVEETFVVIQDFNEWTKWSPWLIMEPDAKVEVSGDGKKVGDIYSWKGEIVGSGELEHLAIDVPKSTDMEIRFKEPWPSKSSVGFRVDPVDGDAGKSKVTWLMEGKIFRAMKAMMTTWIGMDYDRGLAMMKDHLETGKIASQCAVESKVECASLSYVGLTREFNFSEIEAEGSAAFFDLEKALLAAGISTDKGFVGIYDEFDLATSKVKLVAAVVVDATPENLPEGLAFGTIPTHSALKVTHVGAMHLVGNGWSSGMMHLQASGSKQSKKVMPYERFTADYASQPEDATTVEIFFPLK